jgi:hypothetical protein
MQYAPYQELFEDIALDYELKYPVTPDFPSKYNLPRVRGSTNQFPYIHTYITPPHGYSSFSSFVEEFAGGVAVGICVCEMVDSVVWYAFPAIRSVVCMGFSAQKSSVSLTCVGCACGMALARAKTVKKKIERNAFMLGGHEAPRL